MSTNTHTARAIPLHDLEQLLDQQIGVKCFVTESLWCICDVGTGRT